MKQQDVSTQTGWQRIRSILLAAAERSEPSPAKGVVITDTHGALRESKKTTKTRRSEQ